jgi:hypothetical protein
MGQKLLVTILMLVATVSFAQHERYQQQAPQYGRGERAGYQEIQRPGYQEIQREIVDDRYEAEGESHVSNVDKDEDKGYAGENDQAGKFNGDNQASDTQSSPQINIYNANSNANKQKSLATGGYAEAGANAETASYTNTGSGNISAARKNLEYKNNDYVVDQLEYDRLEDERNRANKLFGNYNNQNYAKAAYVEPAYVAKAEYKDDYKSEAYPVKDNYVETDYNDNYSFWQQAYISPLLGFANVDADNVEAGLATGVAFGTRFATNFSVEGSVLYSDMQFDDTTYEVVDGRVYSAFREAQQYTMGVGVSYHFYKWGIFQPKVSGLLNYVYRDFNGTRYGEASGSSTAVDAGVGFGVDMSISKNATIGAELRWMNNLSYSRDMADRSTYNSNTYNRNNYSNGGYNNRNYYGNAADPIEEASYQMFLINAKFNF